MPRPSVVPPRAAEVLHADSLVAFGAEDDLAVGVWAYEFVRAAGTKPPVDIWVHVEDPFGGSLTLPALYAVTISEHAQAFVEQRSARSVLFLDRPLVIGFLVVLLGVVAAVPTTWVRRRLRRERGRRRDAERARVHLAEGREAERLRLARDLHDGPVQHLQVLRLRLATLSKQPVSPDAFQRVEADVQAIIRDLRRTSEDLRPPMLGPFGLAAALDTLAEQVGRDHPSVAVKTDLDDDGQVLPEPVRLALFRIAQEAFANAVRHGQPDRIDVTLHLSPTAITLTVADDGQGFDPAGASHAAPRDGRYGIVGMAERAEMVGASFDLQGRPGEGACVHVSVPLP